MIRRPIVWITIPFTIGVIWGTSCPRWSSGFLFATLLVLLAFTAYSLCHRRHTYRQSHVPEFLILLFWLLFGATRSTLLLPSDPKTSVTTETLHTGMQHQRQALIGRLHRAGLSKESLAFASALTLGQRTLLTPATRRQFSEAGASHLLALSGLHMGILYGLIYLVIIRWLRHTSSRWFALPPTLLLIWGYTLLAGAPHSLLRASFMLTILTLYALTDRSGSASTTNALALTALVMIGLDPHSLFDVGFQLSFIAVFFILQLSSPLQQLFRTLAILIIDQSQRILHTLSPGRFWHDPLFIHQGRFTPSSIRGVLQLLTVSLAAQIGTMPLTTYYFHLLPLLSFLLGIALIPLTTVIIYLTLLLMLLPIAPLAHVLNALIGTEYWLVARWIEIPGIVIHDLHPTLAAVFAAYTLLLLFCWRVNREG